MFKETGLSVKKPKSMWEKSVKVDFKSLFKSLSKSVVQGAFGNWADAITEAIDIIPCFSLENKPEDKAWKLIYSSAVYSIFDIVNENKELFRNQIIKLDLLNKDIETAMDSCNFSIEGNFFKDPTSIPIFNDLKNIFRKWLKSFELADSQVESISNRLDSYFIFSLNNEWSKNLDDYRELYELLNNPFSENIRKQSEWSKYSAWLKKQIDEPLFLEAFSLRQVYVPLNAYYQADEEENDLMEINDKDIEKDRKIVVDLECELNQWIKNGSISDCLKIICGGPGSGKSSFAKVFAAKQAQNSVVKVLYIPLHHFTTDNDLIKSVGKFVKYDGFISYNPLEELNNNSRLLLIFDGLDELEVRGKVGTEVAQAFIRDIKDELNNLNKRNLNVQVLITSRNVAIQVNQNELKKEKQIYNILEYYIVPKNKRRKKNINFISQKYNMTFTKQDFEDPLHLLDEDKRSSWWIKYGKVKGRSYNGIPKEVNNKRIVEITSQPLLNYLVALSYEREKIDFKVEDNLNKIYEDLLESIYAREWDEGIHNSIKNIKYDKFIKVLEEISIATWHGNGRTTTVKDIETYFENSNLRNTIDVFQTGASCGVTRLLLAFYFRKSGSSYNGENTFEFTHKSFGEYLVAKRIIRGIRIIVDQIDAREKDIDEGLNGWSYKEALKSWFEICGPTNIDEYTLAFVKNEIKLKSIETISKWQKRVENLLNYTFKVGIPFDALTKRLSYFEEIKQSRNSEETLFIILNCFSAITRQSYNLEYPTKMYFGEWIKKLQGQRVSGDNPLFFEHINFMNIEECFLHGQDLYGIKIQNTTATGIRSTYTNLVKSRLSYVDFSNSHFWGSLFSDANINNVRFKVSILNYANFRKSKLINVDFNNASLVGANFESAKLTNVKFNNANLTDVNFNDAIFDNVDFTGANFENIKPFTAHFRDTLVYISNGIEFKEMLKGDMIVSGEVIRELDFSEIAASKEEKLE
ncbi:pentapeptide repeat-containing protein [Clostridium sp. ZBS18]|uniref:pentapeptide repeat-containing protein n=1 Tax=Clostridium sp. ZBS18 TaxID=2949967 RepID=UPI002079580A